MSTDDTEQKNIPGTENESRESNIEISDSKNETPDSII